MSKSIVGIITEIHNSDNPPGSYVVIRKKGTRSPNPKCRQKVFVPDFTPDGERQRGTVCEYHLQRVPVYMEDGVLRRAEVV